MLLGFVPDASVFKQEAQKVMKHGAGCFTLIALPVCFPNNRMRTTMLLVAQLVTATVSFAFAFPNGSVLQSSKRA